MHHLREESFTWLEDHVVLRKESLSLEYDAWVADEFYLHGTISLSCSKDPHARQY